MRSRDRGRAMRYHAAPSPPNSVADDRGRSEWTRQRLIDLVRRFEGRRVAVLGDLVADEFVYGDITRISREAPVPILHPPKAPTSSPAARGNAVANLRALGAASRCPWAWWDVTRRDAVCSTPSSSAGIARSDGIRVEAGLRHAVQEPHPGRRRSHAPAADRARRSRRAPARGCTRQVRAGAAPNAASRCWSAPRGFWSPTTGTGRRHPRSSTDCARCATIPVLVDSRARVAQSVPEATGCTPNQEELECALDLEPLSDRAAVEAAAPPAAPHRKPRGRWSRAAPAACRCSSARGPRAHSGLRLGRGGRRHRRRRHRHRRVHAGDSWPERPSCRRRPAVQLRRGSGGDEGRHGDGQCPTR